MCKTENGKTSYICHDMISKFLEFEKDLLYGSELIDFIRNHKFEEKE
jgi:hypothetical protein